MLAERRAKEQCSDRANGSMLCSVAQCLDKIILTYVVLLLEHLQGYVIVA